MNRQAQAVVLLLVGGTVVKASTTDLYLRYVKQGLQPFLVAAGLLLVVAAIMTLWYDLRGTGEPGGGQPAGESADGHDHEHHGPHVGWLLAVPALALLLIAPPALGSYTAGQAGSALANERASVYPPLPPGDPARISVLDYASRAAFDGGTSIGERSVLLSGFITAGPDGQPVLTRIVMSCCAADGRPIKVGLTGDSPTGLAADRWVEVTGRYSSRTATDPVNGAPIPYLDVTTWREIEPPAQQYE